MQFACMYLSYVITGVCEYVCMYVCMHVKLSLKYKMCPVVIQIKRTSLRFDASQISYIYLCTCGGGCPSLFSIWDKLT